MIGPKPSPRLNAMPLLNVRLNRRLPMTSMLLPSDNRLIAHCFLS